MRAPRIKLVDPSANEQRSPPKRSVMWPRRSRPASPNSTMIRAYARMWCPVVPAVWSATRKLVHAIPYFSWLVAKCLLTTPQWQSEVLGERRRTRRHLFLRLTHMRRKPWVTEPSLTLVPSVARAGEGCPATRDWVRALPQGLRPGRPGTG